MSRHNASGAHGLIARRSAEPNACCSARYRAPARRSRPPPKGPWHLPCPIPTAVRPRPKVLPGCSLCPAGLGRPRRGPRRGRRRAGRRGLLPAPSDDPVLWPEPRAPFFQGMARSCCSPIQRAALSRLDAGARQRWIDDFLSRVPAAGTATTLLREGIVRRQALAARQFVSPQDVRAQLLFLNGPPFARTVLDCGTTFKPIEVWTYRNGTEAGSSAGSIIVFRPVEDGLYSAPGTRAKASASCTARRWSTLEWHVQELHGILTGGRFDLRLCKEAGLIDRASGIAGLGGGRAKKDAAADATRHGYALRPGGQPRRGPPGSARRSGRRGRARLPRPSCRPAPRRSPSPASRCSSPSAPASAWWCAPWWRRWPTAGSPPRPWAGGTTPAGGAAPPAAGAKAAAAAATAPPATAAPAQEVGLTVEGAVEEAGQVFETFRLQATCWRRLPGNR